MLQHRITLILGFQGSGKTTLAKAVTDKESRLIVFDHANLEYTKGLIFTSLNEWLYYQETWRDENFRHILRFIDDDEISAACAFVWELGNCTLLCEEVDELCSPSWIDESLKKIVKRGRHHHIALVAVSRRLPEVSRLLSSQANCIITFKQAEGIDLSALKLRGFDLDAIAQLAPHAYLTKTY